MIFQCLWIDALVVAYLFFGGIVIDVIEWRFKRRDFHMTASAHLVIIVGWPIVALSTAAMMLYIRVRDGAWPERR